jgi:hypothetical protein
MRIKNEHNVPDGNVKNFSVLKLLLLPTLFVKLFGILRFDSHVRQV